MRPNRPGEWSRSMSIGGGWREPAIALVLVAPLIAGMVHLRSRLDAREAAAAPAEASQGPRTMAGEWAAHFDADSLVPHAFTVAPVLPTRPPVASDETNSPTPSISPTPSLTPIPSATPTPGPEAGLPIVPSIDEALKARLRTIHLDGLSRGARPDVFAKIGDSITASTYFMVEVGCGGARFDGSPEQAALAAIVDRFRAVPVGAEGVAGPCGPPNSFTRRGLAAGSGWTASSALSSLGDGVSGCPAPDNTRLRCEIATLKPSIALIMFGTNELHQRVPPERLRHNLERIAADSIAAGVIPVFGTIPPRADAAWSAGLVGAYNGAILEAANAAGVPLWNSWRAMADPPAAGRSLSPDGIHPSVSGASGADFRSPAVLAGYNGRNLGALQVLARITRVVLDDGPPEP